MTWLPKIIELIKLPGKYFALTAVVTGCVLFLPHTIIQRLYLDTLLAKYGFIVGLAFLISTCFVIFHIFLWVIGAVSKRRNKSKSLDETKARLNNLDAEERAVLREFYFGQSTMKLPMDNPVVAGLITHQILQPVSRTVERSMAGILTSFRINESIRDFISPEILGFNRFLVPSDEGPMDLTTEGKVWLKNNRPPFIPELEHHEWLFHKVGF